MLRFLAASLRFRLKQPSQQENSGKLWESGGERDRPAAEDGENLLQLALEKFLALIDLL